MNTTTTESRYKHSLRHAIPREAYFHPPRPPQGRPMDLRCPNCQSSNLKKASLAYQEGLSRLTAQSRLRGVVFGEDGPNVIVGSDVMNGVMQTELSRALRPPKKWSYGKLLLAAGSGSVASLIAYIHFVMARSSMVSALPVIVYAGLFLVVFLVCLFLVWRHNALFYPRAYDQWERSFVCQRCGTVSHHG